MYFFSYSILLFELPSYLFYITLLVDIFLTATLNFFFAQRHYIDMSVLLCVPILITCFQNVFWGIGISKMSSTMLLFYVVSNIVYAWVLAIAGSLFLKKDIITKKIIVCIVFLVIYSFVLLAVYPVNFVSFVSSFRNLSSLFIFLLLGLVLSKKCDVDKFMKILFVIFIIVFVAGMYQYFIDTNLWVELNIGELWNKKGIYINKITGKPYNHYSAESFWGKPLPRLVSAFAESVNLGSFCLLLVFL